MTPNDTQKEPEKIDYLKLNIHRIIQKEVADNITYIDRLAEESLMRGLSYAEEELTSYIRSLLASQVAELREKIEVMKDKFAELNVDNSMKLSGRAREDLLIQGISAERTLKDVLALLDSYK